MPHRLNSSKTQNFRTNLTPNFPKCLRGEKLMQTLTSINRVLFPCRWFASNAVVFLPCVWMSVLTAQSIPELLVWAFLIIVIAMTQALMMPRLDEFVISNFRRAHPDLKIVAISQTTLWALVLAIVFLFTNAFLPAARFYTRIICIIITALDVIAILTMLGLGLYWKYRSHHRTVSDFEPNVIDIANVRNPVEVEVDFTKMIDDDCIPLGIICQINTKTDEVQVGLMVANSSTSDKKIIFADGSSIDVDDDLKIIDLTS